MNKTPSPYFMAAMGMITSVVAMAMLIVSVIYHAANPSYELPTVGNKDWRPDISHCFKPDEQRELWDCIRRKEASNE